jgi:hypothetical protein
MVRNGGNISIRLHNTNVVTITPEDDIILDSGGWHTSTTKDRISGYARIYQSDGNWYITHGGKVYRFKDNMILHNDGTVTGAAIDDIKEDKRIKAKVKAYAKACADAVPLPEPGAGDCFYCHMVTESNESLGDATSNTEHIDLHMAEGYIVPSLVFHALKESGNTDFIMTLVFANPDNYMIDMAKERVYKSVYRYILKRKGYAV